MQVFSAQVRDDVIVLEDGELTAAEEVELSEAIAEAERVRPNTLLSSRDRLLREL